MSPSKILQVLLRCCELISLRLGFRRNFLSITPRMKIQTENFFGIDTERKFLRNPSLNEISCEWDHSVSDVTLSHYIMYETVAVTDHLLLTLSATREAIFYTPCHMYKIKKIWYLFLCMSIPYHFASFVRRTVFLQTS